MKRAAKLIGAVLLFSVPAQADRISDIRNTKHNLSVTGPGEVRAVSEDEVCVFCHTPHGANNTVPTPLWNRDLGDSNFYDPYQSSSLDAIGIGQPGGTSKLCLSCHAPGGITVDATPPTPSGADQLTRVEVR